MTPDSKVTRRLNIIVPAISVCMIAAFVLIGWAWYASYQQACKSRSTSLAVLHDVILIATTPQAGQHLDAEQVRRMLAFRAAVFARIDQATC